MTFVNNFSPPKAPTFGQTSRETTDQPYDVNFCFPVCDLENDRVKLTPFIVELPSA